MKNIIEETKVGNFDYYELTNELREFENGRSNNEQDNIEQFNNLVKQTIQSEELPEKKPRFISR